MRVILKLGTSTLSGSDGLPCRERLRGYAAALAELRAGGHQPLIVSSGAVACGRARLGWAGGSVIEKQQLAAVGQPLLMRFWEEALATQDLVCAQILLTRADLERRRGYLNARSTLLGLLARGVVPVVNENDTVATEEIRLGDNDTLSARVAALTEADLLILLTDREALYERDPAVDPKAQPIREVGPGPIPEAVRRAASAAGGRFGTGGMATKLEAALLARRAGVRVVIASGGDPRTVLRIAEGEAIGTCFHPEEETLAARKRYLLALTPAGRLHVDPGAARALSEGRSLLTVGLMRVEGAFERGDAVSILAPGGAELARGLVNYDAEDLARLCGRRSQEIARLLGYHYGDEAVHRDHLVML
ncbi:MAG: glutamate 5-kinase [Lysobacterales bacterium]|jgi:glutamate 5-kinase|nr:MAG: glutamate 5-kinase [Xanthomonadales bacterium]